MLLINVCKRLLFVIRQSDSAMGKTRNDRLQPPAAAKAPVRKEKKEEVSGIDKEIIRRLRIQNKKLIEQVTRMKVEMQAAKSRKLLIIARLQELLQIV